MYSEKLTRVQHPLISIYSTRSKLSAWRTNKITNQAQNLYFNPKTLYKPKLSPASKSPKTCQNS